MKIGIVGSGMIVSMCLQTLKELPNVSAAAMWCRPEDENQAAELVKQNGIPRLYTDYGEFLRDAEVDVVYIGVINSLHYDFTKKALAAGKPVICEKPFTPNLAQASELAALAADRGLMLVEAVSFLYFPAFHRFCETVKKLRGIRAVVSNYAQYSRRYDAYLAGTVLPAFDPKFCGGAMYDINIYNINLIVALFGVPKKAEYRANIGPNGIDTSGVATLDYGDFKAVCVGAKDCSGDNFTLIQAANGYVRLNSAPNVFSAFTAHIDGEDISFAGNELATHMVSEFQEFERIFRENDLETVSAKLAHALAVMKVAEDCRRDNNIAFPGDMW